MSVRLPRSYFPKRERKSKIKKAPEGYNDEQKEQLQELVDSAGWELFLDTIVLPRAEQLRTRILTVKTTSMQAGEHDGLIDHLTAIKRMLEEVYEPLIDELPGWLQAYFI